MFEAASSHDSASAVSAPALSVVIPTYGRDEELVETIQRVLRLDPPPGEILVMDQSSEHADAAVVELQALEEAGHIRWVRLTAPSIPAAMNQGLLLANCPVVLFIDDDVIPDHGLIAGHLQAQEHARIVAGQVLQPGEEALPADQRPKPFRFSSSWSQLVDELMGGNFSVHRQTAISIGGFDENFIAVAYRFEAEFSSRARRAGFQIVFEPAASLRHLRAARGGTRSYGDHRQTASPAHAVGRYYYLLSAQPTGWTYSMVTSLLTSVRTRHHLHRPWHIPVTLLAEMRGIFAAVRLLARGPRLLTASAAAEPSPGSTGIDYR